MITGINSAKASFSRREAQIVDLMSRGYTEKEIANMLFISPITVNNHTRNMRERLGVHKNTELILAYIAYKNKKEFSISKIRECGINVILVLINICEFNRGF